MKSRTIILLLAASFGLFSACKKKCDCDAPSPLDGTWHMKNVSGGLAGLNLSYAVGEVSWTFQETNGSLYVTNNLDSTEIKSQYARFKTGVYVYTENVVNGQNKLFVDGMEVGIYTISNNKLSIDDGVAADGLLTEFER